MIFIVVELKVVFLDWLGDGRLGVLELAVPDLLDLVDLLSAEVEPVLELRALLDSLFRHFFLVSAAFLVIEGLLRDIADFKCDRNDLTEVQS